MTKQEITREDIYRLLPQMKLLQSAELREACADIWIEALDEGGWFSKDGWGKFPFSTVMREDCGENLLTHTGQVALSCAAVYDSMRPLFDRVGGCSRDELIAGALLHDVGKLVEYDLKDGKPCHSPSSRQFRHPIWSYWFAKKQGLSDKLVHMVLTHSEILSPEGPEAFVTPESLILKVIDNMCFRYVEMHCGAQEYGKGNY